MCFTTHKYIKFYIRGQETIERFIGGIRADGRFFLLTALAGVHYRRFIGQESGWRDMIAPIFGAARKSYFLSSLSSFIFFAIGKRTMDELAQKIKNLEKLIASLRQQNEALQDHRNILNFILSGANEGIWAWDIHTDRLTFDENWFHLLGYGPDEKVFDLNWWRQSMHPASQPVLDEALDEYREGENKYYEFEYQIQDKNGGWKWIWARGITSTSGNDGDDGSLKVVGTYRDITKRKQAENEKEGLIEELRKALDEIKTLRGIIPICAYCKQIRDDEGLWSRVEAYIEKHTKAEFSHGICPACYKKEVEKFE